MHNAPPSPFLQSSLHTSLQSGVVVPSDKVVLEVVVDVVDVVTVVVAGGFIVDEDSLVVASVTDGGLEPDVGGND